jgi:hypothetical protein
MEDPMKIPAGKLRPFNPMAGVFESDREFHEGQVAQALIDHLGLRVKSWEPRPVRNATPDFVVVREDNRRIGIETTEFLDQRYAQCTRYAKEHGKPIPPPRQWDAESIENKVRSDIVKKDQKQPIWGGRLDEYLVAEYTDEPSIISQPQLADAALMQMAPIACSLVTRAFFVLLYVPPSAGPRPRIYEVPVQPRGR